MDDTSSNAAATQAFINPDSIPSALIPFLRQYTNIPLQKNEDGTYSADTANASDEDAPSFAKAIQQANTNVAKNNALQVLSHPEQEAAQQATPYQIPANPNMQAPTAPGSATGLGSLGQSTLPDSRQTASDDDSDSDSEDDSTPQSTNSDTSVQPNVQQPNPLASLLSSLGNKGMTTLPGNGYELGTAQNMLASQQAKAGADLVNNIGKAGSLIGAGLARQQVNPQGQALFDSNIKQSNDISNNFKDLVANEKNDPQSNVSSLLRNYLKQSGIDVGDNVSAANVEQVLPSVTKGILSDKSFLAKLYIQQQHNAEAEKLLAQKGQQTEAIKEFSNKLGQPGQQGKAQASTSKAIEQLASRGAVAKAYEAERLANNADSLLQEYPNLNDIPQQKVNIFINEMGKLSSGGAATQATFKELGMNTPYSSVMNAFGKLGNAPTGAQLGAFLKDQQEYLHSLQQNSRQMIGQHINSVLEGNKPNLSPEGYQTFQQLYKPYLEAYKNKDQSRNSQPSQTSPQTNQPKTVIQNGHTYTLNPSTGQYE